MAEDTIVACATPPGEGAIAIVRLSGQHAGAIAARLAPTRCRRVSHRFARAVLSDGAGHVLDDAMVVEMHAPRSYTGEDVVEFHLHGSRAIVRSVLEACYQLGARPARAGEFTLRAFLNGKIDLAQAEAVADLILAQSQSESDSAARQLRGTLSHRIEALQEQLERVLADWRAALDFPEHDSGGGLDVGGGGIVCGAAALATLQGVRASLQVLLDGARVSLRQGRRVVLCGAPNVGKSSLLNAWAGERRVLVHHTPGTTRDPVEAELTDGVVRWFVCDTAGVRAEANELEQEGIALAFERAAQADLVLWLVAPAKPPGERFGEVAWPPAELACSRAVAVVASKSDLASQQQQEAFAAVVAAQKLPFLGWISALTGEGVATLRQAVQEYLETQQSQMPQQDAVLVRERHVHCVRRSVESLDKIIASCGSEAPLPLDLLACDLEDSAKALGEILGRDVDAAVLERIFADFCIGK